MSNKGARKGGRVARSWREKGRSDRFKNNLAGMARNSRRRRGKNKAELNVPREENIWRVRFFFFFFVEIRWTFDSWTLVDSKTRRYWPDVNRERIDDELTFFESVITRVLSYTLVCGAFRHYGRFIDRGEIF